MRKMFLVCFAVVLTYSISLSQSVSNEEVWQILKETYNFEKVEFAIDESSNQALREFLTTNSFISSSVTYSNLNLANVTEVYNSDGKKSFLIPFKINLKYILAVTTNGNNFLSNVKTEIVKNDVDTNGNGNLKILTPTGNITQIFTNGNGGTVYGDPGGDPEAITCFKKCFEQAYNTICDDFIGCLAWYTNPQVPVVAAIYCAAKCS